LNEQLEAALHADFLAQIEQRHQARSLIGGDRAAKRPRRESDDETLHARSLSFTRRASQELRGVCLRGCRANHFPLLESQIQGQ
jgi:hypothetical protein